MEVCKNLSIKDLAIIITIHMSGLLDNIVIGFTRRKR